MNNNPDKWKYESGFEGTKIGFKLSRWHGTMDWIDVFLEVKNPQILYNTKYFPLADIENKKQLEERTDRILDNELVSEAPKEVSEYVRNNKGKLRPALLKTLDEYWKSELYKKRESESDIMPSEKI
ncbi:MAG: hypothetical protein WA139_02190 [Candidatus Aenigmatarchaeota archaeon]